MNKFHQEIFFTTSNEVIWPKKKFRFHAWVKKCHFGNFTRNWLIGWIGHALLVQPSKTTHRFFSLLYFHFHFFFVYETIVSRNGLSLGYSERDTSSVHTKFHRPFPRQLLFLIKTKLTQESAHFCIHCCILNYCVK